MKWTIKKQSDNISKIIIVLLVSAIMLGNIFSISQLSVFGIIPTFYRMVVVLATIYYLLKRLILKNSQKKFSKLFLLTEGMIIFWIFYALVQLFLISGLDKHEGFKAILALGLAFLSIYCIYESVASLSDFHLIVKTIRIILSAMIILAVFEITTGIHLPTSRFSDPAFYQSQEYVSLYNDQIVVFHTATGTYYNQNDFFFFLALFSPFFFPAPSASKKEKILCYLGFFSTFLVIAMNNAFIIIVAAIAGLLGYLIITKANLKKHAVIWPSTFLVMTYISKWFLGALLALYNSVLKKLLAKIGSIEVLDGAQGYEGFLSNQLESFSANTGSLYERVTIYIDSLKAFIRSKGLGLGPNSFTQYFLEHPSQSGLVNPHNWWLEVLVQYGALVFIAYLSTLIITFIKVIRKFLETKFWGYALSASMCIIFVIGCLSPSSLLERPFQWFPLAFCVSILGCSLSLSPKEE